MRAARIRIPAKRPLRIRILKGGGAVTDWYTGDYEVTPRISEQTLPTKAKTMRDDVTVYGIPKWETSNPYGTTAVIGEL